MLILTSAALFSISCSKQSENSPPAANSAPPAQAQPAPEPVDPLLGVWGGKWDDQWPVFLDVGKSRSGVSYRIEYYWMENMTDVSLSSNVNYGNKIGNYVEARYLYFTAEDDKGMLYGDFKNPRMANLVRITDGVPNVANAEAALLGSGWKVGAIPAAEAFNRIKNPNAFKATRLARSTSASVSATLPKGIWGGKWDDEWPVFLQVREVTGAGKQQVDYYWIEHLSRPQYSRKAFFPTKTGHHYEAEYLTFYLEESKGMVYGNFSGGRMANLVPIQGHRVPAGPDADRVLKQNGWTEGAIPAADALRLIKNPSATPDAAPLEETAMPRQTQ